MSRQHLTAITLSALSLATAACGVMGPEARAQGGLPAAGPASVGIFVARTEPVTLTTELSGRTSAYAIAEVRPQVNGIVKARLFEEGAYVRAGQPLYRSTRRPIRPR